MDNRVTLRLPKLLNDLLEQEKAQSGLSKNQIILKALKQLTEERSKQECNSATGDQ